MSRDICLADNRQAGVARYTARFIAEDRKDGAVETFALGKKSVD
jgi:hypothetical protein